MNRSIFCCPICQNAVVFHNKSISCKECQKSWNFCYGIPDFSDRDHYWNQVPQIQMQKLIEQAEEIGWRAALNHFFDNYNQYNYIKNYIFDETRADWSYFIPLSSNSIVLDMGCGWGAVSVGLARTAGIVYAVDSTFETLRFLNIRAYQDGISNLVPLKLNPLDYPKFPFQNSTFDLIVLNGVLEWVGTVRRDKNPSEIQRRALREIFNLLKPGGYIYIGIENRYYLGLLLGSRIHHELPFISILPRKLSNFITRLIKKEDHRTYVYSEQQYRRLLTNTGFASIDFYWPIPTYRSPRTIIPLSDKRIYKYWINNIMSCNTFKTKLYKLMLSRIIPSDFLCSSYGIVGKKEVS